MVVVVERWEVKKPQEAQKAKALWAMKAAKDSRDDFFMIRLAKRTSREEMKHHWMCGKSTSRIQLLRWKSIKVR